MKIIHKEGSNYYDNMCIDIDSAFDSLSSLDNTKNKKICRLGIVNLISGGWKLTQQRMGVQETRVLIGKERKWFNEFRDFWSGYLEGRPISLVDFHGLRQIYRIRSQINIELSWDSIKEHMDNWKSANLMGTFMSQIYNSALFPFKNLLWLPRYSRVLEYGCSHAPYYRAYREFWGHKKAKWTLADIKNMPFLYTCFSYRNDPDIDRFIVIDENNANNPLNNDDLYDVILITAVLEHVHDPRVVVKMLIEHLKPEGQLVFDYIKSEAKGLDSKQGLEYRREALEYIKKNCVLIDGNLENIDASVGLCRVKRKNEDYGTSKIGKTK